MVICQGRAPARHDGPVPDLPSAHDLARMTLEQQHPLTRGWLDDETRLVNLAGEQEFDLQLATDHDLAARRAKFLNVGQPPGAFLNRWVEVGPDLRAMLSIRFKGLDRDKPFVEALTSRAWTKGDLGALKAAALDTYGAFKPLHLRLWSAEVGEPDTTFTPDRRVLAGRVGDLNAAEVPPELDLRPTADLGHYEEARAAYAAVDGQHPAHRSQAQLEAAEDLQEGIEAGLLFDVRLNGVWAGYVGVQEGTELGLNTYTVQELILAAQARGRGHGPALTTLLARHLPDPGRVLLGSIDAANRGALTAAVRAGRRDVGGWDFLPLAGP